MKGIVFFIIFILFTTIILPIFLIKGYEIVPNQENKGELKDKYSLEQIKEGFKIKVYDIKTKEVVTVDLEEYIKEVVAAEMPAKFNMEALKAQAVAARTFSIFRLEKYKNGHPDHQQAALCTGIHCQAHLSKEELRKSHGENWMYEYWDKIEEAVESTKGEILTYDGKMIEPLFHSTSGGMTENSEDVFVSAVPYLRAVSSPYEDGAPRLKALVKISVQEFIQKIRGEYPNVNITKENLSQKVKLINKSEGGRVKQLMIDNEVVSGRDIRRIFSLNSTNFEIVMRGDVMEITTIGYGHGVGMSQWGANGMGNNGSSYKEILYHYYTGVKIMKLY